MIRENEALLNRLNIVTDLAALFLSVFLSYSIRFYIDRKSTRLNSSHMA